MGRSEDNWIQGSSPLLAGAEEAQLTAMVAGNPVWVYRAIDRSGLISKDWPAVGPDLLGSQWQAGNEPSFRGETAGIDYQQQQGRMRDTNVLLRSGLRIGGVSASGNLERKLALLKGVGRMRQDGLLWMAIIPCIPDCTAAAVQLDGWMGANSRLIGAPETAGRR
jgi:hypothetical protein